MKKTISLWDNMAKSFHTTSSRSRAHRAKYKTVADIVLQNNPVSILDLGCGSGLLESELLRRGYRGIIQGYDGSEKMLAIANNSISADNVNFTQSMIDCNFEPGQSFDAIVSINLLFYLDDKTAFLDMVARHLNGDDSVFVLITPKPGDQTSNWEFVKAHLNSAETNRKASMVFKELLYLPSYVELAIRQRQLSKLEKNGMISIDHQDTIVAMASNVGLVVKKIEDIHAGQSWLFVIKSV